MTNEESARLLRARYKLDAKFTHENGAEYTVIGFEQWFPHIGFVPTLVCKYTDSNGLERPFSFHPSDILTQSPEAQQL